MESQRLFKKNILVMNLNIFDDQNDKEFILLKMLL